MKPFFMRPFFDEALFSFGRFSYEAIFYCEAVLNMFFFQQYFLGEHSQSLVNWICFIKSDVSKSESTFIKQIFRVH